MQICKTAIAFSPITKKASFTKNIKWPQNHLKVKLYAFPRVASEKILHITQHISVQIQEFVYFLDFAWNQF